MSFEPSDLSVLAYANNFTLWHYTTEDENIEADDYFYRASDMLRKNDLIIANFKSNDKSETSFFIVTEQSPGHVSIAKY